MKKLDWSAFTIDLLSVVLGIIITFGIQGLIDRHNEKKEVLSALELVRDELASNAESLQEVVSIVDSEKNAAKSISANVGKLNRCDADSVSAWHSVLGAEYFFTVTDDALELLKSSSLFQKINDKNLALGIIKAYDYLDMDAKAFNTHEEYKRDLFMDANTDKTKKALSTNSGPAYLNTFYSTPEALFFLASVVEMAEGSVLDSGLPDINATIADIESRLDKKKNNKK